MFAKLSGVLDNLPRIPRPLRMLLVGALHVALFSSAYICAFLIRFDFEIPGHYMRVMWRTLPLTLTAHLGVFAALRMFQGWWKYVSLYDLMALARGLAVAGVLFVLANVFIYAESSFPRSIYILNFGLTFFLVGGARGSLRLLREAAQSNAAPAKDKVNLLILGAGDTGETLVREINKNRNLPFKPIGFLDDNAYTHGLRIHGIPVLGTIKDLPRFVEKYHVEQLIIAMPSATRAEMRSVVDAAKSTGVDTKILPAVESILQGSFSLKQLREVSINDLLGRDAVKLDMAAIGTFLQGRSVLVTGAGGSIGSEICRQVMRFAPSSLILVERAETPLFFVHRELQEENRRKHIDSHIIPCIADIRNHERIEAVFRQHRPDVVLHAAAYKHVPMMEANPCEAVLNNIAGTRTVADTAAASGVSSFVLISTDKAVNPTSVMGTTKRITELYVQSLQSQHPETTFCAVRFGNVLGSNGSVVPIFRKQIQTGGPVTVTHPEMTRFFMTIPEAVQLVLQAATLGQGGEIFILDMGEPVKIVDLARDMIRLSGLSEDDIEIIFSGIRPGEKLFEELTLEEEIVDKTTHHKIFIGRNEAGNFTGVRHHFDALLDAAGRGQEIDVRRHLKSLVPTYRSPEIPPNVVALNSTHTPTAPTKHSSVETSAHGRNNP